MVDPGIDIAFPNATGNYLRVLRTEIEDSDGLMHRKPLTDGLLNRQTLSKNAPCRSRKLDFPPNSPFSGEMPYRICKIFEVESGHQLSKHPGACKFPHGHSRQVQVILETTELDEMDMVCDFKAIKQAVGEIIDRFDHRLCVNSEDPHRAAWEERYPDRILVFPGEDPTTEVMARFLFKAIERRLAEALAKKDSAPYAFRQPVRIVKVRVTETRTSWAEYYE